MPGCQQPGRPLMRLCGTALLVITCCLGLSSAQAASLQVSPVSLEFKPEEQAQALWLSNSGKTAIRAQIRVMQWSQDEQGEHLQASRGLITSPPMLLIAPGQRQLVRIIRPEAGKLPSEGSYRLLIDELPSAGTPAGSGLQFLLSYSLPVFITPAGQLPLSGLRQNPDALSAVSSELYENNGNVLLTVNNKGAQRLRLSQMSFTTPDGKELVLQAGLLGYVLAGSRMQWRLSLPARTLHQGGTLKARINDDAQAQTLLVRPAR